MPNNRELQQIVRYRLFQIHQILTLETLCIFTRNNTAKPYFFLVIDATLASDNPLCFRNKIKINHDE